MADKLAKVGVKKEKGYLYFVNKNGDVGRAKMRHGRAGGPKSKQEIVAKVGIKKEPGFLYFIDKQGDIGRAKMAKPGQRKKK